MPPDSVKPKNYRQPSITSFFGRKIEPELPAAKQAAGPSRRDCQLESVPWEELDKLHRESVTANTEGGTTSNHKPSADMSALSMSKTSESADKDAESMDMSITEDDSDYDNLEKSWMSTGKSSTNGTILGIETAVQNELPVRDWWGDPLGSLTRCIDPSHLRLPSLSASSTHHVVCDLPGSPFVDKWDDDHVNMPCSSHLRQAAVTGSPEKGFLTRWEVIRNALTRTYSSVADFGAAKSVYTSPAPFNPETVAGLATFVDSLPSAEASFFLGNLLPFIAGLVLDLPFVCNQPIPLLKCGIDRSITLSQKQIAHLLAAAFFCTFPRRKDVVEDEPGYPYINFDALFRLPREWKKKRLQAKLEKLKCIVCYFHKIKTACPTGKVTFHRRSLTAFPNWKDSPATLSKVHITHKGRIEDEGVGCLQADFANKYIGGGVLNEGCVQEEIRFVINPELIVSRLFTQELQSNEVLIITGAERFSDYSGYGDSFTFTGAHVDITPRDSWDRRLTQIVAMDALKFGKIAEQYHPDNLLRELNKAFTGFFDDGLENPPRCVATGNWGCGAFRGEPRLKFVLQLMAASVSKRDLVYFTFGNAELQEELHLIYEMLLNANATVGDIYWILVLYFEDIISKGKSKSMSLYRFLSNCFGG